MNPPVVYLDTSFFIGLLENVANRRQDAKDVLLYEAGRQSKLFTSMLTINEFMVKTYDLHRKHPDCEQKVEEDAAKRRTRFRVNKRTHRIRFEGETEDNVEIVIEPKDEP